MSGIDFLNSAFRGLSTYPTSQETGPSLARDVELVRASILYADEIELVSLGAVMLAGVAKFAEGDESDVFALISALDDETIRSLGGEGLAADQRTMLPAAMAALQLDPALSEQMDQLRRAVRDAAAELRLAVENMVVQSGEQELSPAFDAGILKLSPSGFANGDTDSAINGWIELLKRLLQDQTTPDIAGVMESGGGAGRP